MTLETEQPAEAGGDAMDESRARAESILAEAHWKPHPEWGCFTKGSLVAGIQPDGQAMHIKDWARIPPGHPFYSADTPDEPHEAAEWLVRTFGNGAPIEEFEPPISHETESESAATDEYPPEPLWAPEEPESLGAELLAAEEEEGQIPGDDAAVVQTFIGSGDVGESAREGSQPEGSADHRGEHESVDTGSDGETLGSAYPGVAILPDDLSVALALVIEAVAAEEEARILAVETLQADDLQSFRDYSNWPAGVEMPAHIASGATRFQALSQQRAAIQAHSLALRRSARDHRARGDLSALQGMADGVSEGWP